MKQTTLFATLFIMCALILSACSQSPGQIAKTTETQASQNTPSAAPAADAPGHNAKIVDVSMRTFKFLSPVVNIKVGDKVRFTNTDNAPHTATGKEFDTGTLNQGESKTITFDTPGVYEYQCNFHTTMKGKIIVEYEIRGVAPYDPLPPRSSSSPYGR